MIAFKGIYKVEHYRKMHKGNHSMDPSWSNSVTWTTNWMMCLSKFEFHCPKIKEEKIEKGEVIKETVHRRSSNAWPWTEGTSAPRSACNERHRQMRGPRGPSQAQRRMLSHWWLPPGATRRVRSLRLKQHDVYHISVVGTWKLCSVTCYLSTSDAQLRAIYTRRGIRNLPYLFIYRR